MPVATITEEQFAILNSEILLGELQDEPDKYLSVLMARWYEILFSGYTEDQKNQLIYG